MAPTSFFLSKCSSSPSLYAEGNGSLSGLLEVFLDEEATVTVTGLKVYETPLEGNLGSIFTHDFLILEMRIVRLMVGSTRQDLLGTPVKVRAEKQNNGMKAGIQVIDITAIQESDVRSIHCAGDLNVTIEIAKLLEILFSFDPDYNAFRDNCWKYAFGAYKELLKEFQPKCEGADAVRISKLIRKSRAPTMPTEVVDRIRFGPDIFGIRTGIAAGAVSSCSIM